MIRQNEFFFIACRLAALLSLASAPVFPQQSNEFKDVHILRRVNAHGNEFMSLALAPDERSLIVGTEKGEVLVWDIAGQKITHVLDQEGPVHAIVPLGDRTVVAAGGPHISGRNAGVVTRWDLESGNFDRWPVAGSDSILLLAADPAGQYVGAASFGGDIMVWAAGTGKLIASWKMKKLPLGLAILGEKVYVTLGDASNGGKEAAPAEAGGITRLSIPDPDKVDYLIPSQQRREWGRLFLSPDGAMLAAGYFDGKFNVLLFDPASGVERGSLSGKSVAWGGPDHVVLFDDEVPAESVRLGPEGKIVSAPLFKASQQRQLGAPSLMTGQAVARTGGKAWTTFQLGAALIEWDLSSKSARSLVDSGGLIYAIDVLEQAGRPGLLLTGGDDRFVRVWNLDDLALRREFWVPFGVPQGVTLLRDGRHAVFSYSSSDAPSEIALGDLQTGEQKKLLSVDRPFVTVRHAAGGFVYDEDRKIVLCSMTGGKLAEFTLGESVGKFAVSSNGSWLAVAGKSGSLSLFDVAAGRRIQEGAEKAGDITGLAVSDDGRYVYAAQPAGALIRWDTSADAMTSLATLQGQAASIRLSTDGRYVALGGDQRDAAVYSVQGGPPVVSLQTGSANVYITGVWMSGDRLLFTTDAGILFDVALVR